MGRGADNYYLILELDFLKPEADASVIKKRIEEKQRFWNKNAEDRERGPKYKQYKSWIPNIAKTMATEAARNAEAKDAVEFVRQCLSEEIKLLAGKKEVEQPVAEAIMKRCHISAELTEVFEKMTGIRILKGTQKAEEIKKEDPNPKPMAFSRFSKLKGSEKYLAVLGKEDLYHFLADSDERSDRIGMQSLSGKELLSDHLSKIKEAFKYNRDNEGTAVKELASLCEDVFDPGNPAKKQEYDAYLVWKQKDEIISKMVDLSGTGKRLEKEQQGPFVDALTQILKNRDEAVKIFKQICVYKDIAFSGTMEADNRVVCGHCFAMVDISHGEKKCSSCGSDLYITCPNPKCKKEVLASSKACGHCGMAMDTVQKVEQFCGFAKKAITGMDIAKAKSYLAKADQLLSGYAKTEGLKAELAKLEQSFSKEIETLDAFVTKKAYYQANQILKTIQQKAPTAQIANAVLIESAVAEAENLYKSAVAKTSESELIRICSQIVNVCADYPGVDALVLKFPPKPVTGALIAADTKTCSNTLTWEKSPSEGEISYKIIRKENTAAASIHDKDAVEIGTAGIPRFVDEKIKAGVDYYYSIYAMRAGVVSEPAFVSGVNLAEIVLTGKEEGDGYVKAEWKPVEKPASVEVWRKEGKEAPARGTGEQIAASNSSFTDDSVENDHSYSYRIFVNYQTGGGMTRTEGVSVTLIPASVPEPAENLTITHIEDDLFEAEWSFEGNEKVTLYCTDQRTSLQYGDVVDIEKVKERLQLLELISSSKNSCRFRIKGKQTYSVIPVTVKHNTAVIGEHVAAVKLEKIKVKSTEWINSDLHIRIEWPEDAVSVLVLYGNDNYAKSLEDRVGKTSRNISKKQFEADQALILKNIEKKDYYITLYSACRVNGELIYSEGTRLSFSNRPKADIQYTIRTKGFLNKQIEVEFKSTEPSFLLPEIDLVSKQNSVPVYSNSGSVVRHIPEQTVEGSHTETFDMKSFPKGSYIKAFFTDENKNDEMSLRPAYGTNFKVN